MALRWCDMAMALRIQVERLGAVKDLFTSLRTYRELFEIKIHRQAEYSDAKMMHPGLLNRGVEIECAVADSVRTVILDQVTNGLAVRMAILYLLSGGTRI